MATHICGKKQLPEISIGSKCAYGRNTSTRTEMKQKKYPSNQEHMYNNTK